MPTERQTWVVDAIEEGIAAVEIDGGQVVHLPVGLLPSRAKEGDVLAVTREAAGGRLVVTLEVDPGAAAAALERSKKQLARGKNQKDSGGDVVL